MPVRLQRRRTKGYRLPESAIYVGRPTVFGNPWKVVPAPPSKQVGADYTIEGPGLFFFWTDELDHAHDFAVHLYREWLDQGTRCRALLAAGRAVRERLDKQRRQILGQLGALTGRDLACWCAEDFACHADHLLEFANA